MLTRMQTLLGARTLAQCFLAFTGCRYLARVAHCSDATAAAECSGGFESTERTGWLFILFNVCDEIKTLVSGGGWDEHLHHIGCVVSACVNMAIMRTTDNAALQRASGSL